MRLRRPVLRDISHNLLARTWLRPGTVRHSPYGPYRGLAFALTDLMMHRLDVFYRAYESNVTSWLHEQVRPGMTVWVVGAHVGIHVLYIARLLEGQGEVHAFEGWPENFASLQRNIAANPGLSRLIRALPVCIARQPGKVRMAAGASDGKHHLTDAIVGRTLEVEATSLDAHQAATERCPDLILVDIEGYERDALEGGVHALEICHPMLALEHHDRAAELSDWLTAHRYTITTMDRRHIFAS